MLISKTVKLNWHYKNKEHYISKGYPFTKIGDEFEVKVEDLSDGSGIKVNIKCDCEYCKNPYLKPMEWRNYLEYIHEDGKYYCRECGTKLFSSKNIMKSKLKNTISFEQWCLNNNRQDVLDRWDYELNDYVPSKIAYGTDKKYYFKCLKKIHNSELKRISDFTSGQEGSINCKQCNSFAQYGIDNIGEDFLDKYWDYEKNNEIRIDPWVVNYCSDIKVFIKCQEKYYHESYPIKCANFINGRRCSYCSGKKVHPLDSLGKILEDKGLLHLWSDKNKKSPYEYTPMSHQYVYWKCTEGKHEDYPRLIKNSTKYNFRCPECLYFKGESEIDDILTKINIFHNSQHTFNDLIGIGGGLLKFDISTFWDKEQTKIRMLIEYDGQHHFKPVRFGGISMKRAIENYKQQVKNDIIKNLYCAENDIQLIRIPYWEYDNIEKYLRYYLIENNEFDY